MVIRETKSIIIIGFAAILTTFVLLVTIWINSQQLHYERVYKLDTLRRAAKEISNLRQAVQTRYILLHEMLDEKDYFNRDELYEEFDRQASNFLVAKEHLLALSLGNDDLRLWDKVRPLATHHNINQKRVVELLLEGKREQGKNLMINEVLKTKTAILKILHQMLEQQNHRAGDEFVKLEAEQHKNFVIITMLSGFAFFISIGIVVFIVRATTRIQKDLLKADDARIANRMKSEFLANMSHEIRTPLTSILGYSAIAINSNTDENDRRECMKSVMSNGEHLLGVINEILDLSKIESGKLETEIEEVAVFELLHGVADVVRPKVQEKNIRFGINYRFPLPGLICTDPVRIKQILLNIINNAVKFTEQGHVYVNVWCESHAGKIFFEVEDTGIGIHPDQMESVFKAFGQANKSTTRKYGGTGLGLTLSRRLARILGGDLVVTSMPGQGSTFLIEIDAGELEDVEFVYHDDFHGVEIQAEAEPAPALTGKVLLVDDVEDNRKLVSYLVHNSGAEVDTAENGQQALEMLQFQNYDLILMDMQMPVMDGIEATRQIRERGLDIPVVALTANAFREAREQCEQVGVDGFLSKPIDVKVLNSVLVMFLEEGTGDGEPLGSICSDFAKDPELRDIVEQFVATLPDDMVRMEGLYHRKEWHALTDALHSLKGTSGNMGFIEISEYVATMEKSMNAERYSELGEQLLELQSLIVRIDLGTQESVG